MTTPDAPLEERIACAAAGHQAIDVSVVAANFNNGAHLADFFESCLCSTVYPFEWIFVDDGSTDDSLAIARAYASRLANLRIVSLTRNQGFAAALNAGIQCAHGRFIARVDPDDILMPERLQLQYAAITTNAVDVVGCNALYYHSECRRDIGRTNFPSSHEAIVTQLKRGELSVLHATVMGRAELFRKHPYVQARVPAEDYDLFARIAREGGRFMNLSIPGIRYRVHRNSVSNEVPYATVAKTYQLRDAIFGTHTLPITVWSYFVYIRCYRRGRFARHFVSRLLYLTIAALARPGRVVARLRTCIPQR